MLKFKWKKYSLEIFFDDIGANLMIKILDGALTKKNTLEKEGIVFIESDKNEISIINDTIEIMMSFDEIEYAKIRFEKSLIEKSFYPAEIADLKLKKKTISLYAIYEN